MDKILANHEARHIVEFKATGKMVSKSFEVDFEMDARGYPIQIACDCSLKHAVSPKHKMRGIGMTFLVNEPS